VVENHEDGTRTGSGRLVPKAVPQGSAGSGLRCCQDDGGAIFGQSQERQFSRATGWTDGLEGVGKDGIEGQEGRVRACFTHSRTARARVLEDEPMRASAEVNVRRAAGKPIPTTSLGFLPPSRYGTPARETSGADGARETRFRKATGSGPEDPVNLKPGRQSMESVRGAGEGPQGPERALRSRPPRQAASVRGQPRTPFRFRIANLVYS
jgi:hypothetical protein